MSFYEEDIQPEIQVFPLVTRIFKYLYHLNFLNMLNKYLYSRLANFENYQMIRTTQKFELIDIDNKAPTFLWQGVEDFIAIKQLFDANLLIK